MYSSLEIFLRMKFVVNLLCMAIFLLTSDSCVFDKSPASYNATVGSSYQFLCVALSCDHVDVYKNGMDITNSCQKYCNLTSCEMICTLVLLENSTIMCKGIKRPNPPIDSNKAIILVQDHLDPVTNIISHVNSTHITFSWNIPPVLDSLEIVFSLLLIYVNDSVLIANVSNITTNLWTIELSQDPCILGNLTITGTVGPLESSSHLSNIIFPHRPPISNFTSKLNKHFNGSTTFTIKYKEQCDCPGKQSTHSTIVAHYKDHPSVSYSDIPVTIIGCIGIIKSNADHQLELLGNEHVNVDIWLKNERAQTKQPSLEFNTKDIQNASYIRGSASSGPCFRCDFKSHLLVTNDHAAGCNITFRNINTTERNYTLLYRGNGSSSVFDCFTWFLSGYYDICYTSLSYSEECEVSQYSVYINGTEPESPITTKQTENNLLIIIGSIIASVLVVITVLVITVFVIKKCKPHHKTVTLTSVEEATGNIHQENANEMVGRKINPQPNKSGPPVVSRSTIAYGSMMSEQLKNAGASSLTFSSDTSETSPFVNTSLLGTVPLDDRGYSTNNGQRKLSVVLEMKPFFNETDEKRIPNQQNTTRDNEEDINDDTEQVFSYIKPQQVTTT